MPSRAAIFYKVGTLHQQDLYRIRALKILEMRLAGAKMAEIAKTMNVHVNTVLASIKWASREGITQELEARFLSNLVPDAMKVYKAKLAEGNEFVAKDVIDKMIKLGDRFQEKLDKQEDRGLQAYVANIKGVARPTPRVIDITAEKKVIDAGSTGISQQRITDGTTDNNSDPSDTWDESQLELANELEGLQSKVAEEISTTSDQVTITNCKEYETFALPKTGSGKGTE